LRGRFVSHSRRNSLHPNAALRRGQVTGSIHLRLHGIETSQPPSTLAKFPLTFFTFWYTSLC